MIQISPSILAAELSNFKNILTALPQQEIDLLHMDVMDGHFVPQLSFGEQIVKEISSYSSIPLDVHLMVSNPEQEVPKYFELKPQQIVFHLEATHFSIRLLEQIKAEGIKAGVALNPSTSPLLLEPILDYLDVVLIMSVEPGFYGQAFIPASLEKIRNLKELISTRDISIGIDGGVKKENIIEIAKSGIDFFVAGSAVFGGSKDTITNIRNLKALANDGIEV